jgi:hypothetical protein
VIRGLVDNDYDDRLQAMTPATAKEKLLKAMPSLLADYEHCAADSDGKVDGRRKQRIRRLRTLYVIATGNRL